MYIRVATVIAGIVASAAIGTVGVPASPANAVMQCHEGYYKAASGDCVHRPVCGVPSPPQDATALCNDGCYSFSENPNMDETCSRHGGAKQVLN